MKPDRAEARAVPKNELPQLSDRRSVRRSRRVWLATAIGLVIVLRVSISWLASLVDPQASPAPSGAAAAGAEP